MRAQRLAEPTKLHNLEPHCPAHLDTHLQEHPDNDTRDTVQSARFIDHVIKMNALFSSHLIIRDSHVLDHLGMRKFLLDMEESRFQDFRRFATDPGHDALGLGPVVFASTPYSPEDKSSAFPLKELVRRLVGADPDHKDFVPWQISSAPVPDRRTLYEANVDLQNAPFDDRFKIAMQVYGGEDRYLEYLARASKIWDECAASTRIPRPDQGNVREEIKREFEPLAGGHSSDAPIAAAFLQALPELRTRGAWDICLLKLNGFHLSWKIAAVYHKNFVQSFPSHTSWLSTNERKMAECFIPAERNAERQPKRVLSEALTEVAYNLPASIDLDKLTYKHLWELRRDPEFHNSLETLRIEWQGCHNRSHLAKVVKEHAEMIYGKLGTQIVGDLGRKPTISLIGAPIAAALIPIADLLIDVSGVHHAFFLKPAADALLISIPYLFQYSVTLEQRWKGGWSNLAAHINRAATTTEADQRRAGGAPFGLLF